MHVIPMEMPNRRFPAPPPFAYHPELFPDFAQKNPEPTDLWYHGKDKTHKAKQPIRASVVENPFHFKVQASMTPQVFAAHQTQYAHKHEPESQELADFRSEMHEKLKEKIIPEYDSAIESLRQE